MWRISKELEFIGKRLIQFFPLSLTSIHCFSIFRWFQRALSKIRSFRQISFFFQVIIKLFKLKKFANWRQVLEVERQLEWFFCLLAIISRLEPCFVEQRVGLLKNKFISTKFNQYLTYFHWNSDEPIKLKKITVFYSLTVANDSLVVDDKAWFSWNFEEVVGWQVNTCEFKIIKIQLLDVNLRFPFSHNKNVEVVSVPAKSSSLNKVINYIHFKNLLQNLRDRLTTRQLSSNAMCRSASRNAEHCKLKHYRFQTGPQQSVRSNEESK